MILDNETICLVPSCTTTISSLDPAERRQRLEVNATISSPDPTATVTEYYEREYTLLKPGCQHRHSLENSQQEDARSCCSHRDTHQIDRIPIIIPSYKVPAVIREDGIDTVMPRIPGVAEKLL